MVATLHDVGAIERAEIASAGFRDKKLAAYSDLAQRATRIICVSDATRDAFRALFPLPVDRFAVIHHGLEPRFRPPKADELARLITKHRLPARYLLFVGLISSRKNLVRAVEAFSRIAADDASIHFVLAGGNAHGFDDIGHAIASSEARDRIRLFGYVDDADLPALYGAARALVFPGLAEGFGMPMLEAMACGTPVLAADRPVTHEVVGDAALLANGEDEGSLAEAMASILGDEELRTRLVEHGLARAARFSWANAAEATLAVYRAAVGRPQLA
jgi:glycosyltransferase involved in cell wall biosynthesis